MRFSLVFTLRLIFGESGTFRLGLMDNEVEGLALAYRRVSECKVLALRSARAPRAAVPAISDAVYQNRHDRSSDGSHAPAPSPQRRRPTVDVHVDEEANNYAKLCEISFGIA